MKIVLSDNNKHLKLAPLTLTRPVAELRFGILTIAESWQKHLAAKTVGYESENYLQIKYPLLPIYDLKIAGNIKPDKKIAAAVLQLNNNESLFCNGHWIATRGQGSKDVNITLESLLILENIWDLFEKNHSAINADFILLTENRVSEKLNSTNQIHGSHEIFVEPGVTANFAIFNTTEGPIYLGKGSEVMEGAIIRGPFSLGEEATLKMGAKMYSGSTIGPHCKVGGEVSNSIFQAFSNKGHDGFVGNSLIGEWCNLGADTNTSNLKNNYGKVKVYDYQSKAMVQTTVTFCGVIMGDHSKTGINTMLNTATSVGVAANIFDGGFPPKYIPSFSWGGQKDSPTFILEKAFEVAENMMARRKVTLTDADKSILSYLSRLA